ncbi:MAG: antibiotic biosynthesis monooxygenase [Pedobacter sp.]|nr:MAG: antibiotic biosynthesis monooxygenase [Pedobacter sp.]
MENQNIIHVFATWKVKEGEIENVLKLLKTVKAESEKETGNLFYKIHQSKADVNTIILYEGYCDEAAITAHRETPHFKEYVIAQIVPLLQNREIVLTTPLDHL